MIRLTVSANYILETRVRVDQTCTLAIIIIINQPFGAWSNNYTAVATTPPYHKRPVETHTVFFLLSK